MKQGFLFSLGVLALTLNGCDEDEAPELVNSWHLIEVLADPGDGSGQFEPVDSDKTIEFFADGTLMSNGFLCQMNPSTEVGSTATYSSAEMAITPDNCGVSAFVITYVMEGENLILNYPCFEACREKYELVD